MTEAVESAPARPHSSRAIDPELLELIKKLPYVGPWLAWAVRHAGVSVLVIGLLLFLVMPLALPPLTAMYMGLMPERLRAGYAKTVTEAFSVENDIARQVDEAVAQVVEANNLRLDFVQQFQHVFGRDSPRTPVFSFPLDVGQDFRIAFETQAKASSNSACTDARKTQLADRALADPDAFSVRVLGKERFRTAADEVELRDFGDQFWATAREEVDNLRQSRRATLQVFLHPPVAAAALECYPIRANLIVTVNKSIRARKFARVAETPATEKP